VVLVEAAEAAVVAGAAVEGGVLAVFGSEELHPAVVSATSTATTSRPLVVRPIASHPFVPASKHIWWA
jgi:formylmethanofuran:tetrahydromethanopterin formyltransferase